MAVITGASSGIGYELARVCATQGFDLIVAASSSGIKTAGARLASLGVDVRAVQTDLSNEDGVDVLYDAVRETGRGVDILCANAGRGVGDTFLNEDWDAIRMVIDTNVTGTVYLLHRFARDMKKRGSGRILVTGSIAGFIPGPYQAVYNASKAFVDNFAYALRNEMKDTGVSVTCLMPGATETPFFDKAGLEDTPMGRAEKDNPLDVAITGFAAMMRGDPAVVYGIKNKAAVAASRVLPKTWVAEVHRWVAQPEGNQ
nr:SDR family NAD(P)-dependent oxidoreductase [Rhodomicrobium sp. Az07]